MHDGTFAFIQPRDIQKDMQSAKLDLRFIENIDKRTEQSFKSLIKELTAENTK
jgi:hypothetical protein